ncbi:hypothetical protein [Seleniivibrio woodruffii]|uniref:Uncharacterized protein n=1 Tax=Seleniivibrio woodruffii TaxID=1078050 RepID=A0A4R1K2X4_9BACT|nr:hypothetical protein [Seleniivibrio woodruffii]TCK58372.1 hypothetical protein C8D98_2573 [Seleniivibrio woodruffii]TVZ36746.1 hypothetical protein OF66_2383 [Seleniivibrio woodruffii]
MVRKLRNEIIINLNDERDAYAVSNTNEWIHIKQRKRIIELIQESLTKLENIKDYQNAFSAIRPHDTILISGGRGTGKTTFILSLFKEIESGTILSDKKIELIAPIDPTLIEDKSNILINIISKIKEKVKCSISVKNQCDKIDAQYRAWEESLKALADGLQGLDGIGGDMRTSDWHDSDYIMKKGLSNVHAANNLESNLSTFMKNSLTLLDKEIFMVAFDDIDTNFEKGWSVLEVLRKYLAIPQLITIMTGDISLYSLLVRKHQWENFGEDLIKNDVVQYTGRYNEPIRNPMRYDDTVSELEEQYMLKILKPERRIMLDSLFNKGSYFSIKIKHIDTSQSAIIQDLASFYSEFFNLFGIRSGFGRYYEYVTSQPIRKQKQLMYIYSKTKNKEIIINSMFDIFWTELDRCGINIFNLRNNRSNIMQESLHYLLKNFILYGGFSFELFSNNENINGSQLMLSFVLNNSFENNPSTIFDYLIRIGFSTNFIKRIEATTGQATYPVTNIPTSNDYLNHIGTWQDKSLVSIASASTSYIRALKSYNAIFNAKETLSFDDMGNYLGTAALYGYYKTSRKRINKKRIDEIITKDEENVEWVLAMLTIVNVSNASGQTIPVFSVHKLIGVLNRLINKYYESAYLNSEIIESELSKLGQIKDFLYPDWASKMPIKVNDNFETDEIEESHNQKNTNTKLNELATIISEWISSSEPINISPTLLGRISTRFFYALLRIDEKQYQKLGEYIHRVLIVFLYSILVEELDENSKEIRIQRTNPTDTDGLFDNALKTLAGIDGLNLPFFEWILTCPLITVYLDKETLKKISNYKESDINSEEFNIHAKLMKVDIYTKNVPSSTADNNEGIGEKPNIGVYNNKHIEIFETYLVRSGYDMKKINPRNNNILYEIKDKVNEDIQFPYRLPSIKTVSSLINTIKSRNSKKQ